MAHVIDRRQTPVSRRPGAKAYGSAPPVSLVEKVAAHARAEEDEAIARAEYEADHHPDPARREAARDWLETQIPAAPRVNKAAGRERAELERFVARLAAGGNGEALAYQRQEFWR